MAQIVSIDQGRANQVSITTPDGHIIEGYRVIGGWTFYGINAAKMIAAAGTPKFYDENGNLRTGFAEDEEYYYTATLVKAGYKLAIHGY